MKDKKLPTAQTSAQETPPDAVTYTLERRRFIVSSVFQEDGHDSLGSILVRLMQSELNAS